MNPGLLRHRATLEHPAGPIVPAEWDCAISSAIAPVVEGQAAFMLRGRFHPGITLDTRIVFEGRAFQVQGITDIDERHTELVLTCVEVVARGSQPTSY